MRCNVLVVARSFSILSWDQRLHLLCFLVPGVLVLLLDLRVRFGIDIRIIR